MFFDLNVPIYLPAQKNPSKKGKQPVKQDPILSPAQIQATESKIDILVHLGYSIIGLSQTVITKVDPKTHVNYLDGLMNQLRPRAGIVFLKRLNIILDQDSEKGFGLINANASLFDRYDIISLIPMTHATLSLACLTHSLPSQLTAHIITLPLTLPRLPYHLKHTLIRTAIKNGAVFEINYVGALGGQQEISLSESNAAEVGPSAKRNWWASTRELVRVTKGKGLIISGGVVQDADLRAPRDISNLVSILGLAQDAAHAAATKEPKSLVIRAQTRKTYRAVLSDPRVVLPPDSNHPVEGLDTALPVGQKRQRDIPPVETVVSGSGTQSGSPPNGKKRKKSDKRAD
ncbi:RNase P subunit p30-domain-containing protein [Panaeolus papilionaceus]|nr:RNase P subunit p30-domain-containing protein [Panaeolus papilionaceus]